MGYRVETSEKLPSDAMSGLTPTEKIVASVWKELLALTELPRPEDRFFDLGGHSILAMRAIRQIRSRTGRQLQMPSLLFQNLGQLGSEIDGDGKTGGLTHRLTSQVVRFGPPDREMVGALHWEPAVGDCELAVLICNPLGQEAIRAHRVLRVLAERLADSGVAVLRFDYYGTGDSLGEDLEANLAGFAQDVLVADEYLRQRVNPQAVLWMGLRVGATAGVIAHRSAPVKPAGLVLWEPVVDGAEYWARICRLSNTENAAIRTEIGLTAEEHGSRDGGFTDLFGYQVADQMRDDILALTPAEVLSGLPADCCVIGDSDFLAACRAAAGDAASETLTEILIDQPIEWSSHDAGGKTIAPSATVRAIAEHIESLRAAHAGAASPGADDAPLTDILWAPREDTQSRLSEFCRSLGDQVSPGDLDPVTFHQWSLDNPDAFWAGLLKWSGLPVDGELLPAVTSADPEKARFFPGVTLNYTQCLIGESPIRPDNEPALIGVCENGSQREFTWRDVRNKTYSIAAFLKAQGFGPGDSAVGIATNTPEAILSCLGAVGIGMTWSSVDHDLGAEAVVARFSQLNPRVLFCQSRSQYAGQSRDVTTRLREIISQLPTLERIVFLDAQFPVSIADRDLRCETIGDVFRVEHQADQQPGSLLPKLAFNHPLFVLFSSGTTGAPKGLVHGAGGTLIEHVKEHRLHGDMRPGQRMLFSTSTGWMMWNWQLSALASGVSVVTYDGTPGYPSTDRLLDVAYELNVDHLGISPAYVSMLEAMPGAAQNPRADWKAPANILVTGSILYDEQFTWLSKNFIGARIQSISGGSDIVGCFFLGHPDKPVRRGRLQSISLGYDVRIKSELGNIRQTGTGDLICVNAFPSRPVAMLADTGDRLHQTYFAENPGVWTHGDRVTIYEDHSARMLGRTDGTLNISGARIGPGEIYSIVLSRPDIQNALAFQIDAKDGSEQSLLVLLVVMVNGRPLSLQVCNDICLALRTRASPYHVPDAIVDVADLPVTINGKLSERAVIDAANGVPVRNESALRNPESLDGIRARLASALHSDNSNTMST